MATYLSHNFCSVALAFLCLLTTPLQTWSAESQQTLRLVARIEPRVSLQLSQSQLTFAGLGDQSTIPAQEGPVAVTVKGRAQAGYPLVFSVQAIDLEGSAGRIPVNQVACSFTGEGASGGVVLDRQRQVLMQFARNGVRSAKLSCVLNNPDGLSPGEYEGSATLTLTAP